MRIFYYFRELKTPMYKWQRIHWIDELRRCGHEIITYNPIEYSSIEDANAKVVTAIEKYNKIDLFLTCVDQNTIFCDTIKQIKKKGIPTCLIAWDNLELPYKHKKIAPLFDLVWLTSVETSYLFKRWGCNKIVCGTYAANPYTFIPQQNNLIPVVGFIGSPYGSRINKINDLLDAQIPCQIYSDSLFLKGYNTSVGRKYRYNPMDIMIKASRYLRFPIGRKVLYSTIINKFIKESQLHNNSDYLTKNHSVSDDLMQELYSNFALSLNITELRDTYICKHPITKIHLRTFEIPMSGGLEFATYSDELASYFEDGKEIVLYKSKEEMIDKARFYLKPQNATLVLKMKQAARKRAENDHTWENRFNEVFKALNV